MMDLKVLIFIFVSTCVGLSVSQAAQGAGAAGAGAINPANMTPQQIAAAKKGLQQQCDRCRMCEQGKQPGMLHPCDSFICKFSNMAIFSVCSQCIHYRMHCKTTCVTMCPMLTQIPAG